MDIDKVRNLHYHITLKYGIESVVLLREWEHQKKLAYFHNQRCFMLRCFKKGLPQVAVDSKIPSGHLGATTSLQKPKDSSSMKGLDILTIHYTSLD